MISHRADILDKLSSEVKLKGFLWSSSKGDGFSLDFEDPMPSEALQELIKPSFSFMTARKSKTPGGVFYEYLTDDYLGVVEKIITTLKQNPKIRSVAFEDEDPEDSFFYIVIKALPS